MCSITEPATGTDLIIFENWPIPYALQKLTSPLSLDLIIKPNF